MIKVIFCDLGDTLLTPKKKDVKITDIEAIRRWLERGNQFVIATARHHTFLNKITDKMEDFDFDYIGWNGAEIVLKQKTVKLLPFTKNDVIDIYRNMEKFKMYIKATNINNEYIFESANTYVENLFLNEPCEISNQSLDEYLNEDNPPIIHINYIFPNKNLHQEFYDEYLKNRKINKELYSCKITSEFSYDINVKDATKEMGIQSYLKLNRIPIDQIASIGDSLNDIGMFKLSKYSFCMKHGNEEAKSISSYVINGVNEAIEIIERLNEYEQ